MHFWSRQYSYRDVRSTSSPILRITSKSRSVARSSGENSFRRDAWVNTDAHNSASNDGQLVRRASSSSELLNSAWFNPISDSGVSHASARMRDIRPVERSFCSEYELRANH